MGVPVISGPLPVVWRPLPLLLTTDPGHQFENDTRKAKPPLSAEVEGIWLPRLSTLS
jgi:hypothetical protein